jgi:hypothetical protein
VPHWNFLSYHYCCTAKKNRAFRPVIERAIADDQAAQFTGRSPPEAILPHRQTLSRDPDCIR